MEVKDKANEMLKTVLKTEKHIIPEQNLIEDLGMTSLDMIHLIIRNE